MSARDDIEAALGEGLHEMSSGWERINSLLDAHRDEVLAEEGLLPKADVVAWLVKKAREEKSWDAAVLASKVARGAVRPDNLRTLPPDFFEAGHTYAATYITGTFHFQCHHITRLPDTGATIALGYHRRADPTAVWVPADRDTASWESGNWTDIGALTTTRKDGRP